MEKKMPRSEAGPPSFGKLLMPWAQSWPPVVCVFSLVSLGTLMMPWA